ncbi:MAG TPA: cellulose synthase operon protein YhjQ/BcsQ [Candidatus Acidoferrales bacterium]|nr:cellulose synthase operon protein YhjQ/BcsQ [Candidatus Acidoferrales bacterium]
MLIAAIATKDAAHNETWRACLQQTGLVKAVLDWPLSLEHLARQETTAPDVVLLDLSSDTEASFAFASRLRQIYPAVRIVAYTPLAEPNRELLMRAMRCGVQDIVSRPLEPLKLQEVLARFLQEGRVSAAKGQNLVVVMGAKGGVGTTTVAINLGVQLSQMARKRTVILDYARPIGHAALLLDLQVRFSIRDAIENLDRLDGHFFGGLLTRHKSGLEILPGMSHPEEWHRVPPDGLARIVNVAQSTFDFVILDYGTLYAEEASAILPLARMVLFVTEANVPALWALQRHLTAIAPLGLESDRVRIVVNRWHRGDDEVLKSVEKDFRSPIFARLPNDFRQVSEAINQGTPLSRNHNNPLVATFRRIAGQLAGMGPVSANAAKRKKTTGLFSSF